MRADEPAAGVRVAALPVVFPVYLRTRGRISRRSTTPGIERLRMIEPVSYLEMLVPKKRARFVLTGLRAACRRKRSFGVPCLTCGTETEWVGDRPGGA